jgi:hypothetical protein
MGRSDRARSPFAHGWLMSSEVELTAIAKDLVRHAEDKAIRAAMDVALIAPPPLMMTILVNVGLRFLQLAFVVAASKKQDAGPPTAEHHSHPHVIAAMRCAGHALQVYPDDTKMQSVLTVALKLANGEGDALAEWRG